LEPNLWQEQGIVMPDRSHDRSAISGRRERGQSARRRPDRFTGDIAPVRRQTTLMIALTLLVIVALAAVHRAVKNIREPVANAMPPPAANVDMLDAQPGNLYVKAVARGEFAEVFFRTAWMQARLDYLRDTLGETESDRAADEFFRQEQLEFLAFDDTPVELGADGVEDRILFGRALGCELVSREDDVVQPAIRPGERLSEYRYKLTYPNASLTPSEPSSGLKVKELEASLFTTARDKVVKANVVGNAVIHADTIKYWFSKPSENFRAL